MKPEYLKLIVREKYSEIAGKSKLQDQSSCCGSTGCCNGMDYTVFSDNYTGQEGYNPDAVLGLGCGMPVEYADIKEGSHVLDLGSGAGNECFVARTQVGESGSVTGLDFADAMLNKAEHNRQKTGFTNIEFVKGDIEAIPLPDDNYDVVISNCVLNLVPDKKKAFSEIYRILKPGGHFCISDIVLTGQLPEKLKEAAEMYAGCVSGALQIDEYLEVIQQQAFKAAEIRKRKEIKLPNAILLNYLTMDELRDFKRSKAGILSITVTAVK